MYPMLTSSKASLVSYIIFCSILKGLFKTWVTSMLWMFPTMTHEKEVQKPREICNMWKEALYIVTTYMMTSDNKDKPQEHLKR